MNIAASIINIQRKILERTGRKTDAYYSEGQGALYVFMGYPLTMQNVIFAVSEMELMMNEI
ncbi:MULTISPECIES: hypothetical protein [unclassified Lysinibacillus]|uniref:hypothetical protein n=1 Tax=unclassified Lysinibacillus TaxID=2636778 RepID=UPI0025535F91|nr:MULTISPECIES: hypothetical protein [unclassified Lysinibacillus]MDM5249059.1 hypothetical protein [Lysinibacillus sp. G4S2]